MAKSGMAIAALILGICSFIPFLGIICAFVALTLGIIALHKINADPAQEGRSMAIAGIILAGIGLLLSILTLIGALAYFGVLNPTKLSGDKCAVSPGMACMGRPARDGNVIFFTMKTTAGYPMTLSKDNFILPATCTDMKLSTDSISYSDTITLNDGDTFTAKATCVSDAFKGDFKITLNNPQTGLPDSYTISIYKN